MCNVNKDQVPTATNNPFNKENSTRKKVEITHVRLKKSCKMIFETFGTQFLWYTLLS